MKGDRSSSWEEEDECGEVVRVAEIEEAASEHMAAAATMATRAWQHRSEGRHTASTPPPTKKLTMVTAMTTAGIPNPHPHQCTDVDGRDARRGGGEVVEVKDSAVLV